MAKIYSVGALVSDIIFEVPDWVQPNKAVHASHVTLSPGGKALNQAVAASRLDGDVFLIGCIGNDAFGDELLSTLNVEGVALDGISKHESARTSMVGIIVKDNIPGFIGAPDASKKLTEDNIRAGLEEITSDDILLLNFEIPQPLIQLAAQIGHETGATIVLNPAPYFTTDAYVMNYLHLVDVAIPNVLEAQLLTETQSDNHEELAQKLLGLGVSQVVLTNGAEGSYHFDGERTLAQAAFEVEVVDTTGASDAYVGAYCLGLLNGWATETILRFATATAACACTQHGTMSSMPTLKAVEMLLDQNP